MKKVNISIILLLLLSLIPLQATNNLPLHLKIMFTEEVSAPEIWNNNIFLTARPNKNVRYVGVAFDYEQYSKIHTFEINEKGIYIFTSPVPEQKEIRYRLIIDGLWMADPLNPNNFRDEQGITVSTLSVPDQNFIKVVGPEINTEGKTVFSIRSRPDATVSIVGSFNGWDPYMTPMKETASGVYSTEMRLREGSYFYYYIIDGKKSLDPLNFTRARNIEGEEVCRIDISKT